MNPAGSAPYLDDRPLREAEQPLVAPLLQESWQAQAMALWDSLDDEDRSEALPVDADLCNEPDRRWAAHLQNPTAAVPWEQVRGQLGLG